MSPRTPTVRAVLSVTPTRTACGGMVDSPLSNEKSIAPSQWLGCNGLQLREFLLCIDYQCHDPSKESRLAIVLTFGIFSIYCKYTTGDSNEKESPSLPEIEGAGQAECPRIIGAAGLATWIRNSHCHMAYPRKERPDWSTRLPLIAGAVCHHQCLAMVSVGYAYE